MPPESVLLYLVTPAEQLGGNGSVAGLKIKKKPGERRLLPDGNKQHAQTRLSIYKARNIRYGTCVSLVLC